MTLFVWTRPIQLQVVANNYDTFDWQHNGNGQLIVDPTDPTNIQYDPDESDIEVILTLTLTNEHDTTKPGGCDMVSSDTVILTISPEPTANAGPDITVCEGEEIDLSGQVQMLFQLSGLRTTTIHTIQQKRLSLESSHL